MIDTRLPLFEATKVTGSMTILSPPSTRTISSNEFSLLYGDAQDVILRQHRRYGGLTASFLQIFGEKPHSLFSAPGRCEIGGNHTDHNGGRILAAAIDLDVIAAVSPSKGCVWTVYSKGFERPFVIDTTALEPNESEHPTTQLIRGIAAGFAGRGYTLGGLNMLIDSDVLFASGLSSSAALEMLLGTALNSLFNNGGVDVRTLAAIGREAEERFWGKPVGLLDQLTIAIGGLLQMSFRNPANPLIESVPISFSEHSHHLVLVNPGGDHSTLTSEYKSIPMEMRDVAAYFHKARLIDLRSEDVLANIGDIRIQCGDRAVLRALHFFSENERVEQQVDALKARNISRFLELVRESGSSSWRLLQNCYDPGHPATQPISVALALTEELSTKANGRIGYRVHGGGFGGTILAITPQDISTSYIQFMERVFGEFAARKLHIRPYGCVEVKGVVE
jgi:galactokinase